MIVWTYFDFRSTVALATVALYKRLRVKFTFIFRANLRNTFKDFFEAM